MGPIFPNFMNENPMVQFRARYGVCDFGEINRFFTNPYSNGPDSDGTDYKNKTWDARTKNIPKFHFLFG